MTSDGVTGAPSQAQPPPQYEICVRGHLGETLQSAFPALRAQIRGGNTVLAGALFIIVANILVDIAYAYLDPRVRF